MTGCWSNFVFVKSQIDYPDTNLLQPYQRHSYCKNDLEKLLALETDEYHIGGHLPEDEQVQLSLSV